jgi:hypothetical protein
VIRSWLSISYCLFHHMTDDSSFGLFAFGLFLGVWLGKSFLHGLCTCIKIYCRIPPLSEILLQLKLADLCTKLICKAS